MEYLELPRPEHPMFSVFTAMGDGFLPCPKESSPPITNDCYTISFKKIIKGDLTYGRTQYDFTNGALFFIAPRQVLQWDSSVVFEQKGFSINFHEDFLKGTELAQQVKKYGFFSYSANEALHLSPKEEKQLESIVQNIEIEYHNNQDEFSKDIIISQLSTLLKYANRFYERQFLNRKELSNDLLEQFNQHLKKYFESGQLQEKGIPSIEEIANKLTVSQRYLSDTLKQETGKTTTEHLQLYLIDEAKNILLKPNKSISEVAYELGFEYPQYFSRLFKKREGLSPSEYREKYKMN
ncbi:response regulator transcription factor [Arenibacter sp. F20364]|uniref:helix-turn-helix domain-containing protein n=1 Tax=Arenibacter sp. F20364 TaxID=2926415 RepID=UPI001FF336B5|nr:response regulator transcription factor [Arenibacter sp. F20364]MCK0192514.1 helix-turn-helix transcriptional regulator [Arenibacter sp. F20364]